MKETKEDPIEVVKLQKDLENASEIFNILGDGTRIKIICLLLASETGEMTVDELNEKIFLSRPAISHHLKTLKESGIVKMREKSRYNYYSLVTEAKEWVDLCHFFRQVEKMTESYPAKKENH